MGCLKMNCDTLKERYPKIVEVDFISQDALFLVYWKDKPKWWHNLPLLKQLRQSQFGVIYPKDVSKFKEGDKVKVSIKVEKVKEALK